MGDQTGIEWTDATWNPVTGCTKVSPGCDHCYAEKITERFHGKGSFAEVTLHPVRLDMPLRWRRPRRVFVNSMSDLFHEDVPDGYIAQVWNVMARCPQHTFQILTKRHARMRSWVKRWADRTGDRANDAVSGMPPMPRGPEAVRATYTAYPLYDWMEGQRFWPEALPNVWLGVSVEDQRWAAIRIPALRETPAAVRFISAEPLLGPVDIINGLGDSWLTGIGWVIVGGESGPGARPMHPDWARSLRDQCTAAGVPFLFKQWGEWAPNYQLRSPKADPPGPRVRGEHLIQTDHGVIRLHKVGKKAAGRLLDGRTWDEYPAVSP